MAPKALAEFLAVDPTENTPVLAKLQMQIAAILADGDDDTYDVDAVLSAFAFTVIDLETRSMDLRAMIHNRATEIRDLTTYVIRMETRLREGGVRFAVADIEAGSQLIDDLEG